MTADEYNQLRDFDASLAVGKEVIFRFTNNHRYRRVKVKITKVNAKSVLGACNTDLGVYPAGHEFKVPRITNIKGWTANNCVEYVAEYVAEEPLISREQAQAALTRINGTSRY